jgi:hypothetical protein
MKRKFVETPEFQKLCRSVKIKDSHIFALQNELLDNPEKGDLIVGSGGARKVRVASDNKGKSGSYRVLYTDFSSYEVIFFWIILDKSDASNITAEEKKFIKEMNLKIKNELAKKGKK